MGTIVEDFKIKRFFVALCLFFLISSMTINQPLLAATTAITLLREPYVQIVKPNSLYIVWTTKESGTSEVHYGIGDYGLTAVATNTYFTTPDKAPYDQYYVHEAFLSGLTPDTLYQYKIFSDGNDLTPAGSITFRSGKPSSVTSFRFAALGDSGAGGTGQNGVANRLEQIQPDLVVHTGDVVYDASYKLLEERYFQIYDDLIQSVWLATLPGNHDTAYNKGQSYVDVFVNPTNGASDPIENEAYYSFDYANAHFTVITSEWPYKKGSNQYNWLQNDLANSNAAWNFVMFHLPLYYTDQRQAFKTNGTATSDLVPLFEQYGVDVVLSGDVHLYERMVPIKGGKAASTDDGGILYVVTGGGGTGLSPAGNPPWNALTANKGAIFHAVMFDINDCELSFSAIRGGSDSFDPSDIFDTFSISHCAGVPTADFSANVESGATPLQVAFTDLSSGHPTSWSWDFGDGTTSTSRNPNHTYVNPGIYSVALTASNGSGSDTKTRTAYITVTEPLLSQFKVAQTQYDVNEAGAPSVTVTVEATWPPNQTTTVKYATANGTAKSGSDYTAASGTLTFGVGETSKTFTVKILNDNVAEEPESFTVALSNAELATPSTATITIIDDDVAAGVRFAKSNFNAVEQDGTTNVTVELTAVHPAAVSVDVGVADLTAVSPADYTATAATTLTFAPGETSKTVPLTLFEDELVEGEEQVQLTLSNVTGSSLLAPQAATLTILDNDEYPVVDFQSNSYTIEEAGGSVALEVVLSKPFYEDVLVDYETSNGNASSGSDYTAKSGTLTIPAGQSTATLSIPILDDNTIEPAETFNVQLLDVTNGMLGSPRTATVTITDNDALPQLSFVGGDQTVAESAGFVTFSVKLNAGSAETVSVEYEIDDQTAVGGEDYDIVNGTLIFAPGQTVKTFTVPVFEDALDEAAETAVVRLVNPIKGALGAPNEAILTITDNDAPPTVQFEAASFTTIENMITGTLTMTLSTTSGQPVSVNWATSNGTAIAGSDYDAVVNATATIPAGESFVRVGVPLINDVAEENGETVLATLSSPINATLGEPKTTTLTIIDDDQPPTVQFTSDSYTVDEGAGMAQIGVDLLGYAAEPVTVTLTTGDETAVSPADYTATTTILTFEPGQNSQTVEIPISDDALDETDETISLTLSDLSSNAEPGTPLSAVLTIADNDEPPTIAFAAAGLGGDEGTTATATVQLSGPSAKTVTVAYSTSNGTAAAGSDYTAASGTLTFAPGQTTATFGVALLDDALDEAGETVLLTLSSPTNSTLGDPNPATLTIGDNDAPPTVQADPAAVNVPENGGTAVVTVTLRVVSGQAVTVTYGTVGETAVSGTHFTPTSGTLTFSPGETSHTVSVPVLDNNSMNGNKTFRVDLSSPVNATLGADDAATVTIEDDELPLVSFAEAAVMVAEDAGEAVLTVELDRVGVMPVTVDYVAEGETAVSGADFTPTSGTLTFTPGETSQTLTLPLLDDTMDEESETVVLRLQAMQGGNAGTLTEAVVTLTDDDAPPTVSFEAASFRADEDGGAAVVTLVLSAPSGREVRVNVVSNGGTAVANQDYTPLAETITFAPGSISQTVSIPLLPDDLSEGNETIHLALGGLQNGTAGEWLTAVVTIIDGDSSTLYLPIIFKK